MKYAALSALLLAQSAAKENNSTEVDQYIKIAEGIMNGTIGDNGIADCVQDAEALYQDAQKLVTDYKAHHYTDAIKDATALYDEAKKAISDCNIPHELTETAWNENDILKFGRQVGAAANKIKTTREENLAKVTQGLLNAYGGKFDLEALLFCIYDEDQAALMVDVAVQAFEQFLHDQGSQKIGDLVGVGIGLYGAYQQFESGLPACEHVWTPSKFDVSPIKKDMSVLSNAMKNLPEITANLKNHEKEIIAKAKNVNGDMEKFGEFFGHLLKFAAETEVKQLKLAEVDQPENIRMVIAEIMQGLFEATKVGTFNITALLDCIYFADQDAILVYEVIKNTDWKDFDFTDLFIMGCGAAVLFGEMQETIGMCEQVDPSMLNWTDLNKISKIGSDKTNIQTVGDKLLFNKVDITADFKPVAEAWKNKEYREFGLYLGNALMTATHAEEHNLFLY